MQLLTMGARTEGEDEQRLGDEGTMSFLDHLDELRKRLIRSAMFIAIAFVTCWFLSDRIYDFLQVPVRTAMLEAKRQYAEEFPGKPLMLTDLPDGTEVSF